MYRGRHQLGQEITLGCLCKTSADVPVNPDAAPKMDIYSATGKAVSGKAVPHKDRHGRTGVFEINLLLDSKFATGLYTVVYRWEDDSHYGVETDTFEVLPGGHADGAVIGMHWYSRPHADFIVQHLSSGKLIRGRNPSL